MLQPNYLCGGAMKIYLPILSLILLSGCSTTKLPQTHKMHKFTTTIIYNDNIGYNSEGQKILGQATWNTYTKTCIIQLPTITDLREIRKLITWGHELLHCVIGHFHPP